ncbi:hypothetical protein [Sphingobacterium faecium]|uniref:hypothetical protein n=1 Tax=Sphingobacterium faecium TaxID=34087 RepID=UPI002468C114|nr:hypothetical protein [Sphingobacterium faecium]MDH5826860.1 hypothetical protein [Sphingobacterium faecium]
MAVAFWKHTFKLMATKNENSKVGIVNKKQQPKKKKTITSIIDKRNKKQEGDGEAGVDPQVEQLNHMPEPDTFPKEKIEPKEK